MAKKKKKNTNNKKQGFKFAVLSASIVAPPLTVAATNVIDVVQKKRYDAVPRAINNGLFASYTGLTLDANNQPKFEPERLLVGWMPLVLGGGALMIKRVAIKRLNLKGLPYSLS